MGKLLKEDSRRNAFEILHERGDILTGMIGNQEVDVVLGNLPRDNAYFMLCGNLTDHVAHPDCDFPDEYMLSVLGGPNHMHLYIVFRVRAVTVVFHGF